MAELKIEEQAGPIEVQDPYGTIQFSSITQNQARLIISTFNLGSASSPIASGLET